MEQNTIGSVPEFTDSGIEEVKQTTVEETVEETETPTELPAEQPEEETQPVVEKPAEQIRDDTEEKRLQGLREEQSKVLKEISLLKAERRDLRDKQKETLIKVAQEVDELQDVRPQDITIIEKVLHSKGYITKEESNKMYYEAVKKDILNEFLDKYPEYKPENDSNDLNWNALQREFSLFALPSDPREIKDRLERAHKAIAKLPSDRNIPAKQQQIKTASVGSGGMQRSSSSKSLDPDIVAQLKHGGFTEEDIHNMESRLMESRL